MPDNRQPGNAPASRGYRLRRVTTVLLSGLLLGNLSSAESAEQPVSLKCARAIDAALAELEEQSENLVIKEMLDSIDDDNGQLVCIPMSAKEIQVRLQSTDMGISDNRLVFSIDAKTYAVLKTFYGR